MKLLSPLLRRLIARPHVSQSQTATRSGADIRTIIDDALVSAGLDQRNATGGGIARVIDDALGRAGLQRPEVAPDPESRGRVPPDHLAPAPPAGAGGAPVSSAEGQFLSRSFASDAGTLAYKLYVPASYDAAAEHALPLLVMLHGCTQSPDDFAAGTRMNALADLHGFLVAYPAQSANANGSRCWNWFRPQDQARGSGEPALIAGMTAQVGVDHRVDPARVYVAGLSAGAAMAVVLGRTYPDVYTAVGVHSGLPYRAAHDMGSAFAAMKGGAKRTADVAAHASSTGIPTIVFHGDGDHTVTASNGDAIVAQAIQLTGGGSRPASQGSGTAIGGRRFVHTTYADASRKTVVEDWRVHGGGHAWMGGSASGSYTDPLGPDASAEMVRFFLQHVR